VCGGGGEVGVGWSLLVCWSGSGWGGGSQRCCPPRGVLQLYTVWRLLAYPIQEFLLMRPESVSVVGTRGGRGLNLPGHAWCGATRHGAT